MWSMHSACQKAYMCLVCFLISFQELLTRTALNGARMRKTRWPSCPASCSQAPQKAARKQAAAPRQAPPRQMYPAIPRPQEQAFSPNQTALKAYQQPCMKKVCKTTACNLQATMQVPQCKARHQQLQKVFPNQPFQVDRAPTQRPQWRASHQQLSKSSPINPSK